MKSKSHNKFNPFRIITVPNRIGSWSYELKNIFPQYRQAFRTTKVGIQFIPFRDSRRKESMFYVENWNAVYIS